MKSLLNKKIAQTKKTMELVNIYFNIFNTIIIITGTNFFVVNFEFVPP